MVVITLTEEQIAKMKPIAKIAKRASKKGQPGGVMAQVHCVPGENHYGTMRVKFIPSHVANEIIAVNQLHHDAIENANKGA